MGKLRPFLRKCHRFQDRFEGFVVDDYIEEYGAEEEDWDWRETELLTSSLATLLETEGAAEALFEFLDEYFCTRIVWISNDSFLSNDEQLHLPEQTVGHLNLLFHVDGSNTVCFYRIASTTPITATSIVSEEVDTLLRLIAKEKNVKQVELANDQLPSTEPFPASLGALKTLVGEAQSPRLVGFESLPSLSPEQWQVIASNCNQNVGLFFSKDDWHKGGLPLIDAMKLNQCPKRLIICDGCFEGLSKATFTAFVAALDASTSLKHLSLPLANVSSENLALLFGAISRNRGLQKLELLSMKNISDSDYELTWRVALASHPTIKAIRLWELPSSEARDRILVRAMRSNTVLQELDCKYIDCMLELEVQNDGAVEEQVRPILELNWFRPVVQCINQERDGTLRECLFAMILLSEEVCVNPAFRYLLLKENPDLLLQFSALDYMLHQQYNAFSVLLASASQLVSVEQRMRVAGMVPHSYQSYFSCGKRKRS